MNTHCFLKLLLFVLLFNVTHSIYAQKFHVLLFIDKEAPDIGRGCEVDYIKMAAFLNTVSKSIGFETQYYDASGMQFNSEMVEQRISEIKTTPNDVIFCYFSSHGQNQTEKNSKFPCSVTHTGCVPIDGIHQKLKQKNARLCITMADCCNNVVKKKGVSKGLEVIEEVGKEENKIYNQLFLEAKGDILVTSSEVGQYSYTDSDSGSYFTNKFQESVLSAVNFSDNITWKNVLDDTKQRLKNDPMTTGKQTPYYEININNENDDDNDNNEEEDIDPNPEVADINDFLNQLCDNSKTFAQRNAIMKQKKGVFFTSDAYVGVYVGTTLVDELTVDMYLSKILSNSNLITNINLIEKKSQPNQSDQKYKVIFVQEIRN
jgi:hypothetical protein